MHPSSITREILMMTTTSFSKRQLCETDAEERNSHIAPAEQLEAACWNGLLYELLPEIMHKPSDGEKLYLWQIQMRKSYLRLSMGTCPPVLEKQFTLDPHIFLCNQELN